MQLSRAASHNASAATHEDLTIPNTLLSDMHHQTPDPNPETPHKTQCMPRVTVGTTQVWCMLLACSQTGQVQLVATHPSHKQSTNQPQTRQLSCTVAAAAGDPYTTHNRRAGAQDHTTQTRTVTTAVLIMKRLLALRCDRGCCCS